MKTSTRVTLFLSFVTLTTCIKFGSDKESTTPQPSSSQKPDDKVDSSKPGFTTPPAIQSGNNSTTSSNVVPDVADLDCPSSLQKYWKQNAFINETAAGPFGTSISLNTQIMNISGSTITVKFDLEAPGDNDMHETITFDACKEPSKTAVVTTTAPCTMTKRPGKENVTIQVDTRSDLANSPGCLSLGSKLSCTFKTDVYDISGCTTASGKTFTSTVWRVNGLPLWGIVKREVGGTIIPSQLNGKLSAVTKTWSF